MENKTQIQSDSYSYQKKYISAFLVKIKSLDITKISSYESDFIELSRYIETYKFPFAELILNSSIVHSLIELYLEEIYKEYIQSIISALIEVFNFEMKIGTSPMEDLKDMCNVYGLKYTIGPMRKKLTKEEELYDLLCGMKEDIKQKKEKSEIERKLKEAKLKYEIIKKIKKSYQSSLEYFKENLSQIDKEINQEIEVIDINSSDDNEIIDLSTVHIQDNKNEKNKKLNKKIPVNHPVSDIPLKKRTSLYFNEKLFDEETINVEYKHYFFPFKQFQYDEITRQINGMLNAIGGRIYIGITDDKIVKGIVLNYKQRDTVRNDIVNSTYDFYPKCRTKNVEVFYLPVKDYSSDTYRSNLYVIKIIVHQGLTSKLYSMTKTGFNAMMRLQGQVANLTAEEIWDEIEKRIKSPTVSVNDAEFQDPVPEMVVEIKEEIKSDKKDFNINEIYDPFYPVKKKKNDYKGYSIKVYNIPFNLPTQTLRDVFQKAEADTMNFFDDGVGKNKGYGYLRFSSLEKANKVMNEYRDIELNERKIEMKLIINKDE